MRRMPVGSMREAVIDTGAITANVRHLRALVGRDDATLRFTLSMLAELAAQKSLDYPTASVAVQRLSQLASRG